MLAVERRTQFGVIRQRRVGANIVVLFQRIAVGRHVGGHHFICQFTRRPGLRGQLVRPVCQRILLFAGNAVGFSHLLGGVPHTQPGGILCHRRRYRQQIAQTQLRKKFQLLAKGTGFVGINQRSGQLFADANRQNRRGIGPTGDTRANGPRHQTFRYVCHRLKAGGAGAADAVGVGMHVHPSAENNLPGNIGRSRHLHNLAKNKLFNNVGGNFAARQHFTHHHFA